MMEIDHVKKLVTFTVGIGEVKGALEKLYDGETNVTEDQYMLLLENTFNRLFNNKDNDMKMTMFEMMIWAEFLRNKTMKQAFIFKGITITEEKKHYAESVLHPQP